jgi:hypothetical protein
VTGNLPRAVRAQCRAGLNRAVSFRYLLLIAGATVMTVWSWHVRGSGLDDWLYFEYGARTLAHSGHAYSSGLHLYVQHPEIQVGPPPLALLAGFQWLPAVVVRAIFVALMAACGVLLVWCAERIAASSWTVANLAGGRERVERLVLAVGLAFVLAWSAEVTQWGHLDDVMAIVSCTLALTLVVRNGRWWVVAALLIGVGVASKPWALIAAPVLLGLPRANRAPAALTAMGTAVACWAPFVIADPGTVSALGAFRLHVASTSTLSLFGLVPGSVAPDWVRPLQMVGGFLLAWWVARSGRLSAVLVLGLLFRTVTDPQAWGYYGLGPLVGAFVWELSRGRRFPILTLAIGVIEITGQAEFPGQAAMLRLILTVVVAVVVLRAGPDQPHSSPAGDGPTTTKQPEQASRAPVAQLASS